MSLVIYPRNQKEARVIWNHEILYLIGRRTNTINQQFQRHEMDEDISITFHTFESIKKLYMQQSSNSAFFQSCIYLANVFLLNKSYKAVCWFNDKQSNCHSRQRNGIRISLQASGRLYTMEGTVQLNRHMLMGSKINWNYSEKTS